MEAPRFQFPVAVLWPRRAHRFDLYNPKFDRRLVLFGWHAFHEWLWLETNPNIDAYCERPIIILPDAVPPRPVDFWVRGSEHEQLYLILNSREVAAIERGEPLFAAFENWCNARAITFHTIRRDQIAAAEPLSSNRLTMVHYVAAAATSQLGQLCDNIQSMCTAGKTLGDLEIELARHDVMRVRAATFKLILSGGLLCPTIADSLLGFQSWLASS